VETDMPLFIVTDLDGTLLDPHTYQVGPAGDTLRRVARAGIPLVFCSSKTRAEIEALQARLAIHHPFIAENGGAIVAPLGYFDYQPAGAVVEGGRVVVPLGRPYPEVVRALREVAAEERVRFVGFSDMTVGDVAEACGLSVLDAQLAKLREYDEPFRLLEPDPSIRSRFFKALHRRGLKAVAGGRFNHVTGDADKGRAVAALRALIPDQRGPVVMAGLGDGLNDVAMLREVDLPIIVRSDSNGATGRMLRKVPTAHVTSSTGPAGWAEAVTRLLDGPPEPRAGARLPWRG
jgi:mannosyl-3-phosphoglycerate phosphatase family protein